MIMPNKDIRLKDSIIFLALQLYKDLVKSKNKSVEDLFNRFSYFEDYEITAALVFLYSSSQIDISHEEEVIIYD